MLDPGSLSPGLLTVVGSTSGTHEGTLALSDDGRTLIFHPSTPFTSRETVEVSLAGLQTADGLALVPLDYSFTVGADPKVEAPFLADLPEYRGTTDPTAAPPESQAPPATGINAACTDLPDGFPAFNIRVYNDPDPGYLLLSPYQGFRNGGIAIIDNLGNPIFSERFPSVIHDFAAQPNGLLTYFNTSPPDHNPKYYALDQTFALVDSFSTGNGYVPDTHDLLFLPNGHFVLMAYDPQPVDMSLVVPGGDPDAIVTGLIIQELDADRNVVFQWRSWDHFQITDFIEESGHLTDSRIDYVHGNALDIMPDGNILLCSRHLNEVTKIDRQTGDIIWRMGPHAKNNQFTFIDDPRGFSHQHDVRWLPDGHLTLFDNGNYIDPQVSHAIEYEVDEVNKTARLVYSYAHTPNIFTPFMGSHRVEASGKHLIGWGGAFSFAKVTELNPDGSVALELGAGPGVASYRAIRSPWRGSLLVTDDQSVDFGTANVGQTGTRTLHVSNGSDHDVTIGCAVSSDAAFAVTTTLPLTLSPGGDATLDLAFSPTSGGAKSGKLYLRIPGDDQFVAQDVFVSGVGNAPPVCDAAVASPAILWPPNHKLTDIAITGVTDPDGDPVTITVTGIMQNEPLDGEGDGNTCPDAAIDGGAAKVRAERAGPGDGRLYQIAFTAADPNGASCDGAVMVFVPHDEGDLPPVPPATASAGPDHRDDPIAGKAVSWEFVDALGPCIKKNAKHDPEPADNGPAAAPTWSLSLKSFEASGSRAVVEYTLAADGPARLAVFDLSGRRVRTLENGIGTAGPHHLEWNTGGLSPGVYFYRLRAGEASLSRMVRIIR